MRYLVKIDKNSIKENPDAGSTILRRPIGTPEIYEKYEYKNGVMINYEKSINQPYETIHMLSPISKYSFRYKYEDTVVQCVDCHEIFSSDKLKYEIDYEGENNKVCPQCGVWNCCQLEFEKLNIEDINESKEHV